MSKQSELNALYRSVRSNYLRNLRSMAARGYIFDRDMTVQIPKKITAASIRNLVTKNKNRYKHAFLIDKETGEVLGRGEKARKIERSLASKRGWNKRRANESREILDQFAAAMNYEIMEATEGGTVKPFLSAIMTSVDDILKIAEMNDDFAIDAAKVFKARWGEIQDALEILGRYDDAEAAPPYYVDKLVMVIREAQGRPVTQEDMRMAGMIGEDMEPDYYPKE